MFHVKVFKFSPIQENTYLLYNDTNKAIIIDPGCYTTEEQETLKKFLIDNQLEPVQLVNTHCHLDHVFGNDWVHKTYGLELYIHPNEEKMLEFAPKSGENWGMPFINYSGPLHFLTQENTLTLGEDQLSIRFTPGHSPGSISFYCAEQGFIISGDVLFYESIGRTDLPMASHEQLLNSIKEQMLTLPDEVIVYSGHGRPTTIGHERKNNPFLS
ncbi:MAG: MBL fold metallo-hydrolase [Sediminibacterium sp.]|nr:MAG: MBL fold metallo-hydrolase [Sediminibacterium sp.]